MRKIDIQHVSGEHSKDFAGEWVAVNHLQREFSPHDCISFRTDLLDDITGREDRFQHFLFRTKHRSGFVMLHKSRIASPWFVQ